MKAMIWTERGLPLRHAREVARFFERFPGPVNAGVVDDPVVVQQNEDGELEWDALFSTLGRLRSDASLDERTFAVLLTRTQNTENWYAARDPDHPRNGFIHLDDFSWVTSAPSSVIATHFVLMGVFSALLAEQKVAFTEVWHDDPRGCFFDFCQDKKQLDLKLRTADLCVDCMQTLRAANVPEELLVQTVELLEAGRKLAVNTAPYLVEDPSLTTWPHPVAITRHKAAQARHSLQRLSLLLDHFDSLIRFFFIAREVEEGRRPEIVERPSLGWWVDQLARSLHGEHAFRNVVRLARDEDVVKLRNETRGHGWTSLSEETYRIESDRLEGILSKIEEELAPFLETRRLVVPRRIELRDAMSIVDFDLLEGSHYLHPRSREEFRVDPTSIGIKSNGDVYLADRSMTWFARLSPYLESAVCPECRRKRLLITDGGRTYIDVAMGHRVKLAVD